MGSTRALVNLTAQQLPTSVQRLIWGSEGETVYSLPGAPARREAQVSPAGAVELACTAGYCHTPLALVADLQQLLACTFAGTGTSVWACLQGILGTKME